ncbi:Protein of unknown function [Thermobacillus xylanilyticus]|uniref:Uncharacterized protein n=1 Tax=Thermobacillus xylanilyticus TaxID=76633 RepID=A0ABN7RMT2_THEXY|nr:Protein of unknown function [Thermobacillus xylanilyticus]
MPVEPLNRAAYRRASLNLRFASVSSSAATRFRPYIGLMAARVLPPPSVTCTASSAIRSRMSPMRPLAMADTHRRTSSCSPCGRRGAGCAARAPSFFFARLRILRHAVSVLSSMPAISA